MFDLEKYLGVWYEVAKNNADYEAGCEKAVAVYTVENGELKIENFCYVKGYSNNNAPKIPGYQAIFSIQGVAKATNNPLVFNITFETGQTGIYRILFTDYEHFSIIGDQKTKYLSVLSRKITLTSTEKSLLAKVLRDYGFDKFVMGLN